MKHWSTHYIGLPYLIGGRTKEGLDCWGLLRLFYLEQKATLLPELPGIVESGLLCSTKQILKESFSSWESLLFPTEGCAVAMSQRSSLHHVGIWTDADGGKVLHSYQSPVVAETLPQLRRRGFKRIEFYAYGAHH